MAVTQSSRAGSRKATWEDRCTSSPCCQHWAETRMKGEKQEGAEQRSQQMQKLEEIAESCVPGRGDRSKEDVRGHSHTQTSKHMGTHRPLWEIWSRCVCGKPYTVSTQLTLQRPLLSSCFIVLWGSEWFGNNSKVLQVFSWEVRLHTGSVTSESATLNKQTTKLYYRALSKASSASGWASLTFRQEPPMLFTSCIFFLYFVLNF